MDWSFNEIQPRIWWSREKEREGPSRDLTWKHLASRKYIKLWKFPKHFPWKLPDSVLKSENFQKICLTLKIVNVSMMIWIKYLHVRSFKWATWVSAEKTFTLWGRVEFWKEIEIRVSSARLHCSADHTVPNTTLQPLCTIHTTLLWTVMSPRIVEKYKSSPHKSPKSQIILFCIKHHDTTSCGHSVPHCSSLHNVSDIQSHGVKRGTIGALTLRHNDSSSADCSPLSFDHLAGHWIGDKVWWAHVMQNKQPVLEQV